MGDVEIEERKKVKYVCLRCGNVYESRAKKPQCNVCGSKRKMKFEEFLKLPEEARERVLKTHKNKYKGEKEAKKGEKVIKKGENEGEKIGERVKEEVEEVEKERKKVEKERVKVEKVVKNEGLQGEKSIEKVEEKAKKSDDTVIKSDDREKKGEKERVKKGEKVKGERVKPKLSIPKPRISLKAIGFISALVFIYMLYKMGFLESAIERLKSLGAFRSVGNNEEEVESVERNPILERVKKNLGSG